jgi:formate hydrogenlyase subunit 4
MIAPGSYIASTIIVILVGAGVSAATVASNAMIALGVAHEYLGVGIGLATTARAVGGSIATTVYSVILQDNVAKNLPFNLGTALIKAGLPIADIAAVAIALVTGNTTSPALELASPAELGAGIAAI